MKSWPNFLIDFEKPEDVVMSAVSLLPDKEYYFIYATLKLVEIDFLIHCYDFRANLQIGFAHATTDT